MRCLVPLVAAWSLIAAAAQAQTMVLSQNKCALERQGQVRQMADSLFIPIAQELVDEGRLTAVGMAYHLWGDEWNVVVWYAAPSLDAFSAAFTELVRRTNQRHPNFFQQFSAWCSEHKDNIYQQGRTTTPRAAAGAAPRRD